MRVVRVVLVAVLALALLAGCGVPEGTALRAWTLVDRDGRSSEIVLPVHVDVPHDASYLLRAHVERPEALREQVVTLSIANLPAPVTLRANGRSSGSFDVVACCSRFEQPLRGTPRASACAQEVCQ